jgi:hypothetical protein
MAAVAKGVVVGADEGVKFGEFALLAVGDVASLALARVGAVGEDLRDLGAAPLEARARAENPDPGARSARGAANAVPARWSDGRNVFGLVGTAIRRRGARD